MAIKTQRFNPIKFQHYKLATTQDELDAEAQRKMALQQQQINANAQLANMHETNANNRANADNAIKREKHAIDQQQQLFANGLAAKQIEQGDERISLDYKKNQLNEQRQKRLEDIAERNQANNDYMTERQKKEDARLDEQRHKKDVFVKKTLALGMLGDALATSKPDDKGFIDLSPASKAIHQLANGYQIKGRPRALINQNGMIEVYDDNGPIMNNGQPVRIASTVIQRAKPLADLHYKQMLGLDIKSGNNKAQKEAFERFKYFKNNATKLREAKQKLMIDADIKDPQIATTINSLNDQIKQAEIEAGYYSRLAEGDVDGLQFQPTVRPTQTNQKPVQQQPAKPSFDSMVKKPVQQRPDVPKGIDPERWDRLLPEEKEKLLKYMQQNKKPEKPTGDMRRPPSLADSIRSLF
jgi:hypothetical protein